METVSEEEPLKEVVKEKVAEDLAPKKEKIYSARDLRKRKRADKAMGIKPGSLYAQVGNLFDELNSIRNDLSTVSQAVNVVKSFMTKLRNVVKFNDQTSLKETIFSRIEDLLLLMFDLSGRTSLADMFIPIIKYCKTYAPEKCFTVEIKNLIRDFCLEAGNDGQELSGQSGWFSTNWELLTQGHFGRRFAGLLNLLIMIGVIPESCEHMVGAELYNILSLKAARKAQPSVFHHLFHTLDWVIDSVIPALQTGNMSLMLSDSDVVEIDQMYRNCIDMVDKSKTGMSDKVKEKYGIQDEAALIVYLTNTAAAHETVKQRAKGDRGLQNEMQKRLIHLDKLQNDLQASWHEKGLRQQPYGVLIRGPSSVGKSALSNIVSHAVCKANGFPEGEDFQVVLNGSDEYQSEFKTKHLVAIFDDVGNTKPERENRNPLFILIQFINNMHCSALSPEADKKGKMDIRCRLVIVTTNTRDLNTSFFSVNPTSIMRRFRLIIDVKLKPSAMDKEGGMKDEFVGISMPDAWDLTLNKVKIIRNKDNALADKWEPDVQAKTDVVGLVEYLVEDTPPYYEKQTQIVEASNALCRKEHCKLHPFFVMPCPKCASDPDFVPCEPAHSVSEAYIKEALIPEGGSLEETHKSDMEDFVSTYFDENEVEYYDALATTDCEVSTMSFAERIRSIAAEPLIGIKTFFAKAKEAIETSPWLQILGAIAGIGVLGLTFMNMNRKPLQGEGAILSRIEAAAKTPSTFVERDNKYQRVYANDLNFPGASVSASIEDFERRINKNLHCLFIQEYDTEQKCVVGPRRWANSWPLEPGRWVAVGHQFDPAKTYRLDWRSAPRVGVKQFGEIISGAAMQRLAGDAVVINTYNAANDYEFGKFMVDDFEDFEIEKGAPIFVYHFHHTMTEAGCDYKPPSTYKMGSKVKTIEVRNVKDVGDLEMLMYEGDNHDGMCGSIVVLGGRNPVILGIHCAGSPERKECGATLIDRKGIPPSPRGRVKVSKSTPMREEIYGRKVEVTTEVHPKNCVHYIEDADHSMEIYGQHGVPLSKFSSDMIESPMLEAMKEEMDYEPTHTAPKKKAARPSRRRHFLNSTKVHDPPVAEWAEMAKQDFKDKLEPLVTNEKIKEIVFPLSFDDAVNGVPGKKGFDPINPKTSMGFPINCPKYRCFVESELGEEIGYKGVKCVKKVQNSDGTMAFEYDIQFDPEKADVKAEVENLLEWFVNGERANVVFRANLKDEAVTYKKVAEDKIRVFSGAPVALVVVSRMLTLPLLNVMTMFPEEFESAVGVDATGRDWEEIANIMRKFGDKKCGDGDFSAYDQTLRPAFTMGAFEVLRFILEKCGFDEELLKAFDGLANECSYPVYEIDGLLVLVFGSNPSGHGLTVILNGFCNSLLMRYAYYAMHNVKNYGDVPLFHHMIQLMTYGDDNMFNVHDDEELFSMKTIGVELARIGIKYTDASKKISEVPFKPFNELSFLKRSFHVHGVIGGIIGSLEKDSIYKSLAMTHKPRKGQRESIAEICAGNLNGALRELYFHSKEEFDAHVPIFQRIAAKSVDTEGHKVSDYFIPVTEERILAQFEATTCCYPEAKAKLSLDGQCGTLPPCQEECKLELIHNEMYEYQRQHGYHLQDVYLLEDCVSLPYDNLNSHDVRFRQICYGHERHLVWKTVSWDCRLNDSFSGDIQFAAVSVRERRNTIRNLSHQMQYLFDNAFGPIAVLRASDLNCVNLIQEVFLSGVEFPLPCDLMVHMRSFCGGPTMPILFPERMVISQNMPLHILNDVADIWTPLESSAHSVLVYGMKDLGLSIIPSWVLLFSEW